MKAARWDVTIERRSVWRRILQRRGIGGPLLLGAPVRWEWFPPGDDSELTLTINGVVSGDQTQATLDLTMVQTDLPGQRLEHRLIVQDPALAGEIVLARGYVVISDGVRPHG